MGVHGSRSDQLSQLLIGSAVDRPLDKEPDFVYALREHPLLRAAILLQV